MSGKTTNAPCSIEDKIRATISDYTSFGPWKAILLICSFFSTGTDWKVVGQTDGWPPSGRRPRKTLKSGVIVPKLGFYLIFVCYASLFVLLGAKTAVAYVREFENRPHHVIFDDLGKMSTGVTYINIAIPLNISIMSHQIEMFEAYLDSLKIENFTINENSTTKERAAIHNMEQLTRQIAHYARKRLSLLSSSLSSLDDLLPVDPSFDKDNERHKRFIFMIPMIICEVNKKWFKDTNTNLTDKLDEVQHELDMYKAEYARLYEDTLPDLIPEYIADNHDAMDQETLDVHVDYLTRTKRDVKFLIDIIKTNNNTILNNTSPFFTTSPRPKLATTPNPFLHFDHLFKHKPRQANVTYIKPGQKILSKDFLLIQKHINNNLNKPQTTTQRTKRHIDQESYLSTSSPNYLQPINTINKHLSHSDLIDLDVPYPLRNKTKRFIPQVMMAIGALGTFLGIFNTAEINNIRREMATMSNNQNLLIKVNKIHTNQIFTLQDNLNQLSDVFSLYLQHNPALLYAQFNTILQSLTDKIGDLKDTIQMLQLQRLSTSTLTSNQLNNIYKEITELASKNNLLPLTNKPQDLFQLDTSYVRVQNEILILIHVPCSSPSSLLTIYKYVPFPIPVKPQANISLTSLDTIQDVFDISSAQSTVTTEGINFKSDADLIAIGKNDKGRHRYILLSSAELSACTKRSQAYMCERHQVTKSDLLGSCLGSLYLQSPVGVINNCKINRIPIKETVLSNFKHQPYSFYSASNYHSNFLFQWLILSFKNKKHNRLEFLKAAKLN